MSQSCQFEFRIPFFVVQGRTSTSAKHFAESVPKFSKKNEAFGKVITTQISVDGKLGDQWNSLFFVGYLHNDNGDCYHVTTQRQNG